MIDATPIAPNFVPAPKEAPVLRGMPVFGNLFDIRKNPMSVFMRAASFEEDVVNIPVGPRNVFLVRRPEHVKYVLQDNVKTFSKRTRGYEALRLVLGNGLLTSEGDFWLRQRRLAQPSFHRQRIAGFGQKMTELTGQMLETWLPKAVRREQFDVAREMMALTLRIVGWTLLGTEVGPDSPAVGKALTVLLHQVIRRTTVLLKLPSWAPTPSHFILNRARSQLDRVVTKVVEERRRAGGGGEDLLGMLMSARDEETGQSMSNEQLRDEVMTIFLAGHETTANALTWTLYLLSHHPEIRARLEREVDAALGGRVPGFVDLPKLTYPLAVVQEAMRLYPPVALLMRRAEKEDSIGGYRIPNQVFVAVSPYVTHRDPTVFPNPESFEPDRFVGERAASIPRFAYLPFSSGPRICIGNNFALMEAQLVLSMIVQRYRLDLVRGHPVEPESAVTLRPRYGMKMTIASR